jgi:hypothetical protein
MLFVFSGKGDHGKAPVHVQHVSVKNSTLLISFKESCRGKFITSNGCIHRYRVSKNRAGVIDTTTVWIPDKTRVLVKAP